MNGTNYGGTNQTTSKIAITLIEALNVSIDKYAFVTNSASYIALGGDGNEPVPGSEITYAVTFTNTGSVSAYNFTLSDPLDSSVEYLPGSMKYEEGAQATTLPADYTAATFACADGAADDALGDTYGIEGDASSGTSIVFSFDNAIPAGGSGTVYFKVYIK